MLSHVGTYNVHASSANKTNSRLDGLCNGADLIDFKQQAVAGLVVDGSLYPAWVRDRQIVSNHLHSLYNAVRDRLILYIKSNGLQICEFVEVGFHQAGRFNEISYSPYTHGSHFPLTSGSRWEARDLVILILLCCCVRDCKS